MVKSHSRGGAASKDNDDKVKYLPDKTRDYKRKDLRTVHFSTNLNGYEIWATYHLGDHWTVKMHRLLAVAEFGFDAVSDKIVHHKNGVPWDNRAENIAIMTQSEHNKKHFEKGGYGNQKLTKEMVTKLRRNYDGDRTFEEIAKNYPVEETPLREAIRGNTWSWVDEPPVEIQDTRNPAAKLTREEVKEIKNKYEPYETTRKELAQEYDVSVPAIANIVQGNSWKDV